MRRERVKRKNIGNEVKHKEEGGRNRETGGGSGTGRVSKNPRMDRRRGSRESGRREIRWFAHKLDVISRQLGTEGHTKA